jgi:hypothetical protein
VSSLDEWLQNRALMQDLIKQHLARAQERMKKQTDKHRTEREFQVGDVVYLKLQPCIQSSVARRANQKLAFRFFGPFKIIEKIGVVAYKLLLPKSSTIHHVFHVSQLKKAVPSNVQETSSVTELDARKQVSLVVLQKRLDSTGKVVEILVHWSGFPKTLATWENYDDIKRRFPGSPALELAETFGGGSVSSSAPEATESQNGGGARGPRRGQRTRRPSSRTNGSEWA